MVTDWSRDGEWFLVIRPVKTNKTVSRSLYYHVPIVTNGTDERRIFEAKQDTSQTILTACFSTDGRRVVFSMPLGRRYYNRGSRIGSASTGHCLEIVDLHENRVMGFGWPMNARHTDYASRTAKSMLADFFPCWSPDGKRLAVVVCGAFEQALLILKVGWCELCRASTFVGRCCGPVPTRLCSAGLRSERAGHLVECTMLALNVTSEPAHIDNRP